MRFLALAAIVLIAVGLASLAICDRVLDANDSANALADANNARDQLGRELGEGDPPRVAFDEVLADGAAQGIRLSLRDSSSAAHNVGAPLPMLASGECSTIADDRGRPWRACAATAPSTAIAAVSVEAHRVAIRALARAMTAILLAALIVIAIGTRRALRGPIVELTDLVSWTSSISDAEPGAAPIANTLEIRRLEDAFEKLIRRIFDALARERATSAHIAHELRTPLTAIVAEVEAIRTDDPTFRAALDRVEANARRLADVIDAILLLASKEKIANGFVVNVADLARELAPAGVDVVAPDEALVEGDDRLVALAIRNLIDNAAKYAGGARRIRVLREGSGVRLAIEDEGAGIDASQRAKMFDRYWRGAADGAGRGLGLALVRAVAERHGGDAKACAGSGGIGTEVSFRLEKCVGWHEELAVPR